MVVVGADDALHQNVAHYVAFVEQVERYAVDAFEDFGGFNQSAAAGVGQIDLRDVTGNYRLGIEAERGDEHLDLLRGRVLCLVENDEAVGQRASTHEGDGSGVA